MKNALRSARPLFVLAAALVAVNCVAPDADEALDEALADQAALAGSPCSVTYTVTSEWSTGFGAEVVIKNQSGAAYNGWTVTWTYPSGQKITSAWDGVASQSGANVTVTDAGWNKAVANDASVSFGFNGSLSGGNTAPTNFAVNGVSCNGGGGSTTSSSSSSVTSSNSSGSGGSGGAGGSGGSGGSAARAARAARAAESAA